MEHRVLPENFRDRMRAHLGTDYRSFVLAHDQPSPVSIRVNPGKPRSIAYTQTVPWCTTGYYLPDRPSFALDPNWHAGAYYVQEASSMVLEQVIKMFDLDKSPVKVLDFCASPGGKSTHLASLLHPDSIIICNEVIPKRHRVLRENLMKWGSPNVYTTNSSSRQLTHLKEYFDVLLIDAPCSGEGLFRKNPKAIKEWSIAHSASCSQRQCKILDHTMELLAPGGILLYSTCTYNPAENLDPLLDIAASEDFTVLNLDPLSAFGFTIQEKKQVSGAQAYPHLLRGEGFFISALQKKHYLTSSLNPKSQKTVSAKTTWCNRVFDENPGMVDLLRRDRLYAIPGVHLDHYHFISSGRAKIEPVLTLGEVKGSELVPHHALAVSQLVKRYPRVELDHELSLQYLRKMPLPIQGLQKGWTLVTYLENILGWIKVLDKRINNYYPAAYRLLN